MRDFLRFICVTAIALMVVFSDGYPAASAPDVPAQQQVVYDQAKAALDEARKSLADLAAKVDEAGRDDTRLSELKLKVEAVGKDILNLSVDLQPRFGQLSKRLTEIGDPPAAGSLPEDLLVTADRVRLLGEKAQLNAITSEAEAQATAAGELADHITDLRRDIFTETLLGRTVITSEMAAEATGAMVSEFQEFVRTVNSWWNFTWSFKRQQLLAAVFASLISALVLISGANRIFDPLIRRDRSDENPAYISRLSIAFWSTILPSLSAAVFAVTILVFLISFNVLRQDIGVILNAFLTVLLGVYFVWRLARAVLAPGKPQWRLVNVSDSGARLLLFFVLAMTIVNGMDYLLEQITTAFDSPVVLTIAKSLIASVLIGLLLVALSFIKPMNGVLEAPRSHGGAWPRPIRFTLLIGGFV